MQFVVAGTTKLNGSAIPSSLKNRPRIPTPDVTREMGDGAVVLEKRNSLVVTPAQQPISPHDKPESSSPDTSQPSIHRHNTPELPPVVQVQLSSFI
jgi:hypothetical protein